MLAPMDGNDTTPPAPVRKRKRLSLRRIALLLLAAAILAAAFPGACELYVHLSSRGKLYERAADLPSQSAVGLVLGCSPYLRSRHENPYFRYRIDAAASLWHSGKVRALIVSGDNSNHEYNEPQAMKEALERLGVPSSRIVCDYAGLRTLDSVVRAHEIFGADRIIVVSQPYHNKRALAIANHYGIDALALNARDVRLNRLQKRNWLRERGARMKMVLDLWFLGTGPRHLGDPVPLPGPDVGTDGSGKTA